MKKIIVPLVIVVLVITVLVLSYRLYRMEEYNAFCQKNFYQNFAGWFSAMLELIQSKNNMENKDNEELLTYYTNYVRCCGECKAFSNCIRYYSRNSDLYYIVSILSQMILPNSTYNVDFLLENDELTQQLLELSVYPESEELAKEALEGLHEIYKQD
jgi:hypothetical protein